MSIPDAETHFLDFLPIDELEMLSYTSYENYNLVSSYLQLQGCSMASLDQARNKGIDKVLADALRKENEDLARFALKHGASVVKHNGLCLLVAALRNTPSLLKTLLCAQSFENAPEDSKKIALSQAMVGACGNNSQAALNLLLSMNVPLEGCEASFVHASRYGNVECMKRLYDFGVNPYTHNGRALALAVDHGKAESVRFLFSIAFDKQTISQRHPEILHRAVERGFYDIVSMLLQFGINPNINNGAAIRKAQGDEAMLALLLSS